METYQGVLEQSWICLACTVENSDISSWSCDVCGTLRGERVERTDFGEFMLTVEQKISFFLNGYIIVKGVIPLQMVSDILRKVNQELGKGMDQEQAAKASKGTYCPDVAKSPMVAALFNKTGVSSLVASALGAKTRPLFGAQIALRYPGRLCTQSFTPAPYWNKLWHIDGFASPENSVNPGEIRNFTMLVGIPLSRTDVEHCGNLVVYPGSHHVLQDYFRTAGFDKARQHGVRCLPELKLSSPVQICADMGDVVLLHYQLAHSIAPNCSPNIRYQLYYRVNVRPSDTFYPASMLDIWAEYPGMRDTEQSHAHQVEAHLKSLNPSLVRPAYVDGHARATQLEQSEQEQVFADMQNHAKALFERKQYLEAIPIYEQLHEVPEFFDNFEVQIRAGLCFTFGISGEFSPSNKRLASVLELGRTALERAINNMPSQPRAYALLAHNRARLGQFGTAVDLFRKALAVAQPANDYAESQKEPHWLFNGLPMLVKALTKLNQLDSLNAITGEAIEKFPQHADSIWALCSDRGARAASGWVMGRLWISSQPKNFHEGIRIFGEIVAEKPDDYQATLLLGRCHTWSGQAKNGEPHIRRALALNPSLPHAHNALAQNLKLQGRTAECISVLDIFFTTKFPEVETSKDHAEKILEGIECSFQILGKQDPVFVKQIALVTTHYPTLAKAGKFSKFQ